MKRLIAGSALGVLVLVLAACSNSPLASQLPSPLASQLAAGATAIPIDPCQLVTSQEASQLAGASFGSGNEQTSPGGHRICVYGSGTNAVTVVVGQASDPATAQADAQAAEQQVGALNAAGVHTSQVSGLGDWASFVSLTEPANVNGSGMFVLKGSTFFGISALKQGSAPTQNAMQAEAQTVLGRLP